MPTKTKPKKRLPHTDTTKPIKLSQNHEDALVDCLGWNRRETAKGLPHLIQVLSYAHARYTRVTTRPQASHLVAEFRPIHEAAKKLSELLDQDSLTHSAELMLPPILDRLRADLAELAAGTAATIALYSNDMRRGGAVRSDRKKLLGDELSRCIRFFRKNASAECRKDRNNLREFHAICEKKIVG